MVDGRGGGDGGGRGGAVFNIVNERSPTTAACCCFTLKLCWCSLVGGVGDGGNQPWYSSGISTSPLNSIL